MSRAMVVHFEPFGGGDCVNAEAFSEALSALVDGLKSVSNSLAPLIAQHRSWSRSVVKEALTLGVSAVSKGSVEVALVPGAGLGGAPIDTQYIAALGFKAVVSAVNNAAKGRTFMTDVSASAAESLAKAGRVARDANVHLSIRSRRIRDGAPTPWRTTLDLTKLEPALSKYAKARSEAQRSVTQVVGQIVAITYSPPSFVVSTGRGRLTVNMPASLRQKARACWGEEVVVSIEARVTLDGDISDPRAIDISASNTGESSADMQLGLMADSWNNKEADDYFGNLRNRH